jgi:hypothetical protein
MRSRRALAPVWLLLGLAQGALPPGDLAAADLHVGPGRALAVPSAAARGARDGDRVLIDAGTYRGDVAVWTQNDLTLRGVGGTARLLAAGRAAEGKAIWVIRADRVVVEDIAFEGAAVPSRNGAGIRAEGGELLVRRCRFSGNEMGILTSNNPQGELTIEDSALVANTTRTEEHGRLGHNLYAGRIHRLTLRDSLVADARIGHLVKSRALHTIVSGNRLIDGAGASYLVDIPDGGSALIAGNRLEKSAAAPNRTAIAYAAESDRLGARGSLIVRGNTYAVAGLPGTFVTNHGRAEARLEDNALPLLVRALSGPGRVQ